MQSSRAVIAKTNVFEVSEKSVFLTSCELWSDLVKIVLTEISLQAGSQHFVSHVAELDMEISEGRSRLKHRGADYILYCIDVYGL